MRKEHASRWKRRLPLLLLALGVVACLVVGLGSRLPASPIPGWRELYVALGLAPDTATAEGELEVHFLAVGNADCALIRRGECAVLVDGGEPGDSDRIVEYLRRHGVDRLELVVATHGHADHVGGLPGVLEQVPVERLLVGYTEPAEDADSAYETLLSVAAARQVPVETVQAGGVYTFGGARLHVLWPRIQAEEENDRSIVARLSYGGRAFLFTGDAGTAVETALLQENVAVQADVLKVSHHGGDTASSEAFLRRVAPVYGVIPCGEDNLHGHPAEDVLRRLRERGITCLRNDVAGNIVFTTDGERLTVETESTD